MEASIEVQLQYDGAIGLLCACSVQVNEETRECIQIAIEDWCKLTGWSYKRIFDRFDLIPPEES